MSGNRFLPIVALIIALIVPTSVCGQVPVKVSNQKVISEGRVYYMHEVLKGQTLYSISRAYKVSINDIKRVNVIPPGGIQTGQMLKIPASASAASAKEARSSEASAKEARAPAVGQPDSDRSPHVDISDKKIVSSDKVYYLHEVQKGQTLYSIAIAYKVTIYDITRANEIPPNGIYAGQVLRIPESSSLTLTEPGNIPPAQTKEEPPPAADTASQSASSRRHSEIVRPPEKETSQTQTRHAAVATEETGEQQQAQPKAEQPPQHEAQATTQTSGAAEKQAQPERKKYHKVRRGESLSEIARKYGITVRELREANKGLIFAMPDMQLVIPAKGEEENDRDK
jgi:LysM repeat protein